jgi:hypothetical protein
VALAATFVLQARPAAVGYALVLRRRQTSARDLARTSRPMRRIAVHVATSYVSQSRPYHPPTDPTQCSPGSTCQSGACTTPPPLNSCPTSSTCGNAVTCGPGCYCLRSTSGLNKCVALQGCNSSCDVDSDCGADGVCVTDTCCGHNICEKRANCANAMAPSRLFRRAEAKKGGPVSGEELIPRDVQSFD